MFQGIVFFFRLFADNYKVQIFVFCFEFWQIFNDNYVGKQVYFSFKMQQVYVMEFSILLNRFRVQFIFLQMFYFFQCVKLILFDFYIKGLQDFFFQLVGRVDNVFQFYFIFFERFNSCVQICIYGWISFIEERRLYRI